MFEFFFLVGATQSCIILFKSLIMLCGTSNISQNIPRHYEYGGNIPWINVTPIKHCYESEYCYVRHLVTLRN